MMAPRRRYLTAAWQRLYFLPDPQGQASLRPTTGTDSAAPKEGVGSDQPATATGAWQGSGDRPKE